jgi:hypothetical protein
LNTARQPTCTINYYNGIIAAQKGFRVEIVRHDTESDTRALHMLPIGQYGANPSSDGSYALQCNDTQLSDLQRQLKHLLSPQTETKIVPVSES